MTESQTCPICGRSVTAEAPQGLCPECLMKTGIGTRSGDKTPFVPPPIEDVAKLFPQLELLELLGQGGMGAVYKARQPRLNRFVALKLLSGGTQADPQFTERFEREARTLASLNHPNIVAVYDFGDAQGNFYLLMEFVNGLTLRRFYETGRPSTLEALDFVSKICDALKYAHERGIVHRDIKPENILIDQQGHVKIADFGIAKILELEPRDLSLTGAKDVVGTPHYMAPEQIEKPQTVDCRADIYSLGVVFYEMLTGELPLGKFRPPSQKTGVDDRLDNVVLHALEKEPEHRYQKVAEVKTDVEKIATTQQDAPQSQPAAIVRSGFPKTAIAVIGIAAVVLAVILILSWFHPTNHPVAWLQAEANALDSAGKNNGSLIKGVTFTSGISGQAFAFDGDGACVKVPSSPQLNLGNKVTIEFWMKADALSLKSYAGLVTSDFYLIEISNGGQHGKMGVNFSISTDKGKSLAQTADANEGGASISANQWHLITGVYNGRQLQLYVDGKPAGNPLPHSGSISPMPPGGFLAIGSEDGRTTRPQCIGTRYFNGSIDEIKIYDSALTAGKIKSNFESVKNSRS